jgi:signal transduction histidine kinase
MDKSKKMNEADLLKALAIEKTERKKAEAKLLTANKEIALQHAEKTTRYAELVVANKELAFQKKEKNKRAAELSMANIEVAYQNDLKEKRAKELVIANKELGYQNVVKEKRAAELIIANEELAFQNNEKEKRAAELIIANEELAFQNHEKEKRAAELIIANIELAYQNDEKEKRAAELIIANEELAFQNNEKEKRAAELIIANKELLAFTYISSHDLQEPLRKIQTFISILLGNEKETLSENGKYNFERIQLSAKRMQQLIDDLLAFSRISTTELKFEKTNLAAIVADVKNELIDTIKEKEATIETSGLGTVDVIPFQFRQLMYNLISNALKFSKTDILPVITVSSKIEKGNKLNHKKLLPDKLYCHIMVKDNGIGFESHFSERIFGVFQKLHLKEVYAGTGIGLAIVKKIVENHNGLIIASSNLNEGATFNIYLPVEEVG